ncbi:MAG: hypothetical protein JWM57_4148, partial [Phycisphaerales bacterium]|nr:hypothetical protein [Phycisphaerales bacterium]
CLRRVYLAERTGPDESLNDYVRRNTIKDLQQHCEAVSV